MTALNIHDTQQLYQLQNTALITAEDLEWVQMIMSTEAEITGIFIAIWTNNYI